MPALAGLIQPTKGGHFVARRAKPADLHRRGWRGTGRFLKESTRTADPREACAARDRIFKRWAAEIAAAMGEAPGAAVTAVEAVEALERWRRRECAAAALTRPGEDVATLPPWMGAAPASEMKVRVTVTGEGTAAATIVKAEAEVGEPDIVEVARAYFAGRPDVSRDPAPPWAVTLLIAALQPIERDAERWRDVAGFDDALAAAAAVGGCKRALPSDVRSAVRQRFAAAWLEVVQHREAARQRAAYILAAVEVAPERLRVARGPDAYEPREGDVSLGQLIDGYKAKRSATYGEEPTERKYLHIFRALEELLGRDKPIRAIRKEDCRRVRELLRRVPTHAGKKYPGLTLLDAVAAADASEADAADDTADGVERLAPNTVSSYMSNLTAMFNWAMREHDSWLEKNPASGLVDENLPVVKRRGFTRDELKVVVSGLEIPRRENSWRWWIPLIAAHSGMRLNEICQLRTEDLRHERGIWFLAVEPFDAAGRRTKDKRVKTRSSERNVPLHPDLVAAGFVDFVQALPPGRMFPDIVPVSGTYSHEPSKWFGAFLDKIGLTDVGLVFHSFRHGFRDYCDEAGISSEMRRALGGWATKDEAEKYGNRSYVPVLHREVSKLRLGLELKGSSLATMAGAG